MRRITYSVGRTGTSIIMIGLALLLISLIPSLSFEKVNGSNLVPAEKYQIVTADFLTPTFGSHYEVDGVVKEEQEVTFGFLLMEDVGGGILNWTNSWARDNGGQPEGGGPNAVLYSGRDNFTAIQAYINQFPEKLLLNATGETGQIVIGDYSPASEVFVSFILANPSFYEIDVHWSVQKTAMVAPRERAALLAGLLLPTGSILSAPWLLQAYRKRGREAGH